jgi:hypothetical protein
LAVTVCVTVSSFAKVTVVPAATFAQAGENDIEARVTVPVASAVAVAAEHCAGAGDPELPYPIPDPHPSAAVSAAIAADIPRKLARMKTPPARSTREGARG